MSVIVEERECRSKPFQHHHAPAIMKALSAPIVTHHLVVDRPFMFLLRDKPTGALLFAGQVTNPTTKR